MVDVPRERKSLRGTALRKRAQRKPAQGERRLRQTFARELPSRETPLHETPALEMALREAQLRDAIELFYFAYRSFTAEPDRILAEHGLGRAHHRILYFVGRNPDIAVNELLEVLAVSKQALHAPLRSLLDGKWVSVRPDTRDRRFKRLRLTEAGGKLESRLTGTQMRHLDAVFADLGDRAEEAWRSVMRAMPKRPR